jgi:DNA-directed RNA polymerase subunit E'/Rpb7
MKSKYITSILSTTNVNIHPSDLSSDINQMILLNLKKRYEGVCNKDGYIIKDSIQLINRSIGQIKTINNISFINFNVTYSSDIIYPSIDSEYETYVETINKVGIISYIKLNEDDTLKDSPYIVITPKEYIDDKVFESIKVNDVITVKVKSFRIKYASKQIQIVSELS